MTMPDKTYLAWVINKKAKQKTKKAKNRQSAAFVFTIEQFAIIFVIVKSSRFARKTKTKNKPKHTEDICYQNYASSHWVDAGKLAKT